MERVARKHLEATPVRDRLRSDMWNFVWNRIWHPADEKLEFYLVLHADNCIRRPLNARIMNQRLRIEGRVSSFTI